MKIFQTIQKNHAIVGIVPRKQNQSFNGRLVVTFSLFGLSFTSSAIFLFYKANSFLDYSNNMYITTGQAMLFIVCTIIIFKKAKLFQFIDHLEKSLNQSKLDSMYFFDVHSNILNLSYFVGLKLCTQAIYEKTNQQVEKWCKIGYILMAKITPMGWILPKVIINYSVYFCTNAGNEAFDLPLLMW